MGAMPRPAKAGREAAGRAVRAWRGKRTQQDVAEQAGIDMDTLSALENGTRWPWNRTLSAVEEALGRPPGELDRIAAGADSLSDDDRRLILRSLGRDYDDDEAAQILARFEDAIRQRERDAGDG